VSACVHHTLKERSLKKYIKKATPFHATRSSQIKIYVFISYFFLYAIFCQISCSKWIWNYENVGNIAIVKVYNRIIKEEETKDHSTKHKPFYNNCQFKPSFFLFCLSSLTIRIKPRISWILFKPLIIRLNLVASQFKLSLSCTSETNIFSHINLFIASINLILISNDLQSYWSNNKNKNLHVIKTYSIRLLL
jgi:hypothetical protein